MANLKIKGFPSVSVLSLNHYNHVVSAKGNFTTHAESQRYVNTIFEAFIGQYPELEYSYIYIYLNGDCRYFHTARQLRCSTKPVKIMPTFQKLNCELTESYFKAQNDFEIRYFFRKHLGTYQCLGAAWDAYGSARGNLSDVSGKLVKSWDTEISSARLGILESCDEAPGKWQANGYHYPNKPNWDLFDKAQSLIPAGFHFSQQAIKVEQAALVDDIPADYMVILKDAPRYARQQRAFWDSVKA
ncbi:MAG: hypothetical protein KME47_10065 [Nodosilinea sp. WJT8-NPBG4]|jgi:hypothetical protein|nr:hypothetical protein [Nodosilinea sp. WJT8-NPBG4]